MVDREPMPQTMNVTQARQKWSQLLNRVSRSRERVVVERSGRPVAAIISAEDLARFQLLEQERARDFAVLDEIGEAFKHETPEESELLARQAVAEAREAPRRQQALQEP